MVYNWHLRDNYDIVSAVCFLCYLDDVAASPKGEPAVKVPLSADAADHQPDKSTRAGDKIT